MMENYIIIIKKQIIIDILENVLIKKKTPTIRNYLSKKVKCIYCKERQKYDENVRQYTAAKIL